MLVPARSKYKFKFPITFIPNTDAGIFTLSYSDALYLTYRFRLIDHDKLVNPTFDDLRAYTERLAGKGSPSVLDPTYDSHISPPTRLTRPEESVV